MRVPLLVAAWIVAVPGQAALGVTFDGINAPGFIGRGPGPDGFVGTADDVAAADNTVGAASWGTAPAPNPFETFILSVTLDLPDPIVFANGVSVITDWTLSGTTSSPGGTLFLNDLPSVSPHQIVTDLQWRQRLQGTLAVCGSPPCTSGDILLDVDLAGYLLLPGSDPNGLPGISPALASYLDLLGSVAPLDWTAIIAAPTDGGFVAFAATDPIDFREIPEPASLALLALALTALASRRTANGG